MYTIKNIEKNIIEISMANMNVNVESMIYI